MAKVPNWIVGALTGGTTGLIAAFQGYGPLAILFAILIGFAIGTFVIARIAPLEVRNPGNDQETKEQLKELFKSVAVPAYNEAHKLADQITRRLQEARDENAKQTNGTLLKRFIAEIVGTLTGCITGLIAAFQGYGPLAILFAILIGFAIGTFVIARIAPLEVRNPGNDQETKEQLKELFKSVAVPAYNEARRLADQITRRLQEARDENAKQTADTLLKRSILPEDRRSADRRSADRRSADRRQPLPPRERGPLQTEIVGTLTGCITGLIAALQGYGLLAILLAILIGFAIGTFIIPQISPLGVRSPSKEQEMKEQLKELFKSAADPAYNEAHRLLGQITRTLLETADDNAKQMVGVLLNRFVMEADRAAQTRLGAALKSNSSPMASPERLQYLFGDYYEKYQWIAEWIHRGGQLIDFPFMYDPNYRIWRDEDKKFLRGLRDTIACTEFSQLRQRFNRVGWGEEFRKQRVRGG
ncbi:MAG: hypothetical protein ACE5JS_22675 [Nitrospinota bacterium]